jgi:hypothetical protein
MSDTPIYVCERCREPVVPADPDVVRAVELVPVPTFGAPDDVAEGMGVLFHRVCFPEDTQAYRLT